MITEHHKLTHETIFSKMFPDCFNVSLNDHIDQSAGSSHGVKEKGLLFQGSGMISFTPEKFYQSFYSVTVHCRVTNSAKIHSCKDSPEQVENPNRF